MTDLTVWGPIIDALSEDDFSRDGTPKVKALEDAAGVDLSAAERDEIWAAYQAQEPEEDNTYTLIASKQSPLRITVNGTTILEMYVGQTAEIDPDTLAHATSVPGVIFVKGTSDES